MSPCWRCSVTNKMSSDLVGPALMSAADHHVLPTTTAVALDNCQFVISTGSEPLPSLSLVAAQYLLNISLKTTFPGSYFFSYRIRPFNISIPK